MTIRAIVCLVSDVFAISFLRSKLLSFETISTHPGGTKGYVKKGKKRKRMYQWWLERKGWFSFWFLGTSTHFYMEKGFRNYNFFWQKIYFPRNHDAIEDKLDQHHWWCWIFPRKIHLDNNIADLCLHSTTLIIITLLVKFQQATLLFSHSTTHNSGRTWEHEDIIPSQEVELGLTL